MSGPEDHHRFGPSGLASYESCPRFEKEEEGEGHSPHPVAVEGTMLHAKVERRDLSKLDANQAGMVENCLAYSDRHTEGFINVDQELKLDICERPDGSFLCFGTADVVAWGSDAADFDKAVVIDWKFGWNRVDDPADNLQGQAYVCGAFERFPQVNEIGMHFYMARYAEGHSHTFVRSEDYEKIKLRIETVVARVEEKAPYSPSTKACLYCAAKGRCPAVAKHALALANSQTEEQLVLEQVDAVASAAITDPNQMAKALRVCELLEAWAKAVRSNAKELAMEGVELPGFDLKERRGRQSLGNANGVFEAMRDDFSEDEFIELCNVQLAGLKKAVSAKAPHGSKQLAVELALSRLDAAGLVEEGPPTFVLQKRKYG